MFGNAPASAAPGSAKTLRCAMGTYVNAVTVHLSHTVAVGYTLQYVGALLLPIPLRLVLPLHGLPIIRPCTIQFDSSISIDPRAALLA